MIKKRKIAVIADDFTGAAEIGGIGLRNGLNVAINTTPDDDDNSDLLVIATDTRSMNKDEAAYYIATITKKIVSYNKWFIYKKIDSVLRGNIAEELVAQLKVMGMKRSIIIAANPVFNRIIKDGKYFVDGIPLNETCFSNDSQYPIRDNNVLKIVSSIEGYPVVNLKPSAKMPEAGLIMGDVENLDDLIMWAQKFNTETLFAGASGFFNSLLSSLKQSNHLEVITPIPFGRNALFILGSTYPKDEQLLSRMIQNGHYFSNMPIEIYQQKSFSPHYMEKWANEIVTAIEKHHKVIVASMHTSSTEPNLSFRIKQVMANLVKKVSERIKLNEILIEGGGTTSAIIEGMNIKKLIPVQEIDTGVIRMNVIGIPDLCITTKPGSYLWPENVWLPEKIELFNTNNLVAK